VLLGEFVAFTAIKSCTCREQPEFLRVKTEENAGQENGCWYLLSWDENWIAPYNVL